jgi:hypothetical protein
VIISDWERFEIARMVELIASLSVCWGVRTDGRTGEPGTSIVFMSTFSKVNRGLDLFLRFSEISLINSSFQRKAKAERRVDQQEKTKGNIFSCFRPFNYRC